MKKNVSLALGVSMLYGIGSGLAEQAEQVGQVGQQEAVMSVLEAVASLGIMIGIVIALVVICTSVFFGIITRVINKNRGYEGGFWWGFFLRFIGIMVVASKADNVVAERMEAIEGELKDIKREVERPL